MKRQYISVTIKNNCQFLLTAEKDKKKRGTETVKTDNKKIIIASVIMIVSTILLCYLGRLMSVEKTNVTDSLFRVQNDGSKAVYLLSVKKPETNKNYYLNLKTHGSTVKVLVGGEEIYEYGEELAAKHKLVGKTFLSVLLPETAYSGKLSVETAVADGSGTAEIETAELCDSFNQQRYFVTNETLGGLIGPVYLVLAGLLVISSLIMGLNQSIGRKTLLFGLILLGMAGEILDTGGHYLIFMDDQHIWNIFFQIDAYLLPTFCIWYSGLLEEAPVSKRVAFGGTFINFCILAVVIVSEAISPATTIADYRFFLYAVFAVTAAIVVYDSYRLIVKHSYSGPKAAVALAFFGWFLVSMFLAFSRHDISTITNASILDPETVAALLVLYVLGTVFVHQLKRENERLKAQEERNLKLEAQINRMQLQNFNSQMQPHFLYNALSSIKQIIYEDPDYAAGLISDFTRHLRGTIKAMSCDHPIPFSEELENIRAYVRIENVRLGEKLTVSYDIRTEDFEIIPLSVQPIVENAIRHGIYHRGRAGGTVTLRSEESADQWIIQVIDNGVGFDVQKTLEEVDSGKKDSTGLKNLIFRLEKLMDAKVEIKSVIDRGTTVTVSIPKGKFPKTGNFFRGGGTL